MKSPSDPATGLHVVERATGTPVVLLHAFPVDGRIFEDQIDALSHPCRVIVPDLPGFGRSPAKASLTIESMAQDIHALLEARGALPCVLGGLSLGGYIALAFARRYASDLRALMLMDTRAAADSAQSRLNRDENILLLQREGSGALARQMLPKVISDYTRTHSPARVNQLQQIMSSQNPRVLQQALEAMRDRRDQTDLLPSIAVPTLVLAGADDSFTGPDIAEPLAKAIPRSTLRIIPNAGHLSPFEQPETVTAAIHDFLKDLAGASEASSAARC